MKTTSAQNGRAERASRAQPIFAAILAIYPILFIASINPGQVSWRSVAIAAGLSLLAAGSYWALIRPLLRSSERAALGTALLIVVFFAYGPAHTSLEKIVIEAIEQSRSSVLPIKWLHPLLSVGALLIIATGTWALSRLRDDHVIRFTRGLNVAAFILLTLVGGHLIFNEQHENRNDPQTETARDDTARKQTLPDIYYIILDGYARADILAQYYDFDNREFIAGLHTRGFVVNDSSSANYYWTFLSLASSLNYTYVQDLLGKKPDPLSRDRTAIYATIRRNAAADFLRARGYRIVHLQSTWGATRSNPHADVQLQCAKGFSSDEFYRVVAEASWLKIFQSRLSADLAHCHLSNFDLLAGQGHQPGPKFVFSHILLPHHPYLFDRNGRILRNANLSNQFEFQKKLWEEKPGYLEQLQFLNSQVLATIDAILAKSNRPPVIILQSDHGPNLRNNLSQQEQIRIRLANFGAYLLPGAPPGLMPSDSSPVNQFRRLFNHYFDAGLDLLPERYFVSTYLRPFALREVSGIAEGRPQWVTAPATATTRLPATTESSGR